MNFYPTQMKKCCRALILTIFPLLLFLNACINPSISKTPNVNLMKTTASPINSTTPTARSFITNTDCGSDNEFGHILFLRQNTITGSNSASNYDLYVMNGNGCFPKLLMIGVSGSPSWSLNGQQIAIGCEDNTHICLLSTTKTLEACSESENTIGSCQPTILKKYPLPLEISGENIMYNISFSSDDLHLAVEGENIKTKKYVIYLLKMINDGVWEKISERDWSFDVDWSPIDNRLVVSGMSTFMSEGSNAVDLIPGIEPEWSPDGKMIAFIKASNDENKEPFGLALFTLETNRWEWLYEPAKRDKYYWPPQNLILGGSSGYSQAMSWSPDGKMIAFVSIYRHGYDSQIFRLDIRSGDIVVLTANLEPEEESSYFFSPAWGP